MTAVRPAAAPPVPAPTPALPVPARVMDLDLDRPGGPWAPGRSGPARGPDRSVPSAVALVRRAGRPLGLVALGPDGAADGAADGGPDALRERLVAAAERRFGPGADPAPAPAPAPASAPVDRTPPTVTVVVCTRGRTTLLGDSLRALLRTDHPATEILVVDNAPEDDSTERLVRGLAPGRLRYLREPVPGLARARNRGLAAAHGEIVAFTDDDTLADPGWAGALAAAFRADPRIACVTGLVVPAELDTEAQALFERYCGFGKGFAPRDWSRRADAADPLFPFAAGRFGTGANMAFRTATLRRLGGFDPATGAGTPTRGGEDLLAFLGVLAAGHTLAYRPEAVVWHRHRRTRTELEAQIRGFGIGLGGYLTAAVVHRPALLADLLRRVPAGTRYALRRATAPTVTPAASTVTPTASVAPAHSDGAADPRTDPALARLGRIELRGLLLGPAGYLVGRAQDRRFRAGSRS
ncbi:Glycosyltransferase like family 2 [Streptomyces sp. TLI_053]|uniref:glycosyltransferase family 2 protein n=1 Tax=Streptomyces sp. TLI_053 TaxID=1855352 RepID=UPI00087A3C86|nr:glycosyltransferase family 2 protein [Streptomyces sp. TLI_053]SDT29157.1 Glycosyltransferase like family 2 [Streptomyces sp. TLI_053]